MNPVEDAFRLQRRKHYQRDEHGWDDLMPGEHLDLSVMTEGKAGDETFSGFGSLRVRAMEGRGLVIEITDELSNVVIAAQVDQLAGRRTRPYNLAAPLLARAIADASREDGPEPFVFPEPV
jgi:hypothetical protein